MNYYDDHDIHPECGDEMARCACIKAASRPLPPLHLRLTLAAQVHAAIEEKNREH